MPLPQPHRSRVAAVSRRRALSENVPKPPFGMSSEPVTGTESASAPIRPTGSSEAALILCWGSEAKPLAITRSGSGAAAPSSAVRHDTGSRPRWKSTLSRIKQIPVGLPPLPRGHGRSARPVPAWRTRTCFLPRLVAAQSCRALAGRLRQRVGTPVRRRLRSSISPATRADQPDQGSLPFPCPPPLALAERAGDQRSGVSSHR